MFQVPPGLRGCGGRAQSSALELASSLDWAEWRWKVSHPAEELLALHTSKIFISIYYLHQENA